MKKAIITGATGLIGSAFSKYLVSKNLEVLCIGRKQLTHLEIKKKFGYKARYFAIEMKNISNLNQFILKSKWKIGNNCVFFNFAWSGIKNLTDGSLEDQLKNATYAEKAVKIAKKIGCTKFVNVGTLEETFAEQYFKSKKNFPYSSNQTNYTIAKLTSRDICKISAYLEKIDYIHTRLSLPLKSDLSSGSYVAKTLKKILQRKNFDQPSNTRLFDIIFIDDVVHAYYLIGKYGKNKANYFIGTSDPITLKSYFNHFKNQAKLKKGKLKKKKFPKKSIFDIKELQKDTGFKPKTNRYNLYLTK